MPFINARRACARGLRYLVYVCVCVCVSAVYKLLTRFLLEIEHINRLYTNFPRFPTYRFLSNAFFHELQRFSSFSMLGQPFCSSPTALYTMCVLRVYLDVL